MRNTIEGAEAKGMSANSYNDQLLSLVAEVVVVILGTLRGE